TRSRWRVCSCCSTSTWRRSSATPAPRSSGSSGRPGAPASRSGRCWGGWPPRWPSPSAASTGRTSEGAGDGRGRPCGGGVGAAPTQARRDARRAPHRGHRHRRLGARPIFPASPRPSGRVRSPHQRSHRHSGAEATAPPAPRRVASLRRAAAGDQRGRRRRHRRRGVLGRRGADRRGLALRPEPPRGRPLSRVAADRAPTGHAAPRRAAGRPAGRLTVSPHAPCAHCGLPVGPRPVFGDGGPFCCTGCAVVYRALAESGLDGTYYHLRRLTDARAAARPLAPDPLQVSELDTERFLAEETRPVGDGARAVELFVDGVHCAACVWLVERMPYEVEGVRAARLDLPRARLSLQFDPARVRLSAVAAWLARFGYAAQPVRQAGVGQRTEAERELLIRTGVAWALAGNVMLVAFALYSGLDGEAGALATAARWASLALTLPSVAYGGAPFFQRAWASVRAALRAR